MIDSLKALNDVFSFVRSRDFESATASLQIIKKDKLSAASQRAYEKLLTHVENNRGKVFQSEVIEGEYPSKQTSDNLVYCILAMQHEIDVLKMTVSPLIQQLEEGDAVYILFNGFIDHPLKVHLEKHAGIKVFQTDANLGVAGGRNLLYADILKDEGIFDYVITLDNDVIVPNDFNLKVKSEVSSNYSEEVGVLGSVILDYKKNNVKDFIGNNFLSFPGYLSATNYNIFTDEIKSFVLKSKYQLETVLWHIGIDKDYQAAYIERTDLLEISNGKKQSFFPFLAHAPNNTELIEQDVFEVSNIPGCFQLVSTKVLRKAGLLEESFSPYFFEDSEFCIRLQRLGLKNIISSNILLFHGTDNRHLERKAISSKFDFITNEYRARLLLLKKLKVQEPVKQLVGQALRRYLIEKNNDKSMTELVAAFVGLRKGLIQLSSVTTTSVPVEKNFTSILRGKKQQASSQVITFDELLPKPDEKLPQVYFSQLKKFRNAYSGQDCLIVCNGPSLKNTRLGLFKNMPTFCVNSTFILQNQLGFKPDFYTVEDNHVIDDNIENIIQMDSGVKFFPDKYREKFGDSENQFYLPTIWDCYWKSKISHENPEFSKDITRGVYTGQTVTYLNLQLAYFMGFKRVFIVGLDFSYSIPKGSKIDNNSIDHDDDDPNHFHPGYFGKGRQWHFPKLDSCMVSYSIAEQEFEKVNREVIDLTLAGRLNVFRKATLEAELGLENLPEQLESGLSLRQFIIDSVYSDSVQVAGNDFDSLLNKKYCASIEKHSKVWSYSKDVDFLDNMLLAIREPLNSTIVIYLEANCFVSHNSLSTSSMPHCSWYNSTVNTKVGEVDATASIEEILALSNDMSFFVANSTEGYANLTNFIKYQSLLRMMLVADKDRILIKVLGKSND